MTQGRQYSLDFEPGLMPLPKLSKRDETPGWMTTFLDIMALLLTFFVMLLAMSSPNPDRFDELAGAVKSEFASEDRGPGISLPTDLSVRPDEALPALPLGYVEQLVSASMAKDPLMRQGRLTQLSDRLVISLPSEGVFQTASAELSRDGVRAMATLAERLAVMGNRITLVGHTDPTAYEGDRYHSNWALGLSRASAVGSIFRELGYNRELRVISQADSRFGDLANDLEPQTKARLARRVDVVVHPDQGRTPVGGGAN